jgi:hypothetical protein
MNPEPIQPPDDSGDLEQKIVHAVQHLPGVLAAAVWLSGPKRIRALHITAAPRASGPIIANAAARMLRRHGVSFEMDMIRVAFRDGPERVEAGSHVLTQSAGRFLVLHDLTVTRAGSRVTCRVMLRRDDEIFEGETIELDSEAGRVRAAARATLAAAERSDPKRALGLEGTAILALFGRQYVAASIEAALDRRFATLAGLVPIDPARSPEEAGCLAALRAIERWIAW